MGALMGLGGQDRQVVVEGVYSDNTLTTPRHSRGGHYHQHRCHHSSCRQQQPGAPHAPPPIL